MLLILEYLTGAKADGTRTLPKPDFYIAAPLYRELSFSPEARRGPTRQPLLAFSSQDLRPGPWPARHRRFHALGSTGLLCGRLLVALVESVLAARRV